MISGFRRRDLPEIFCTETASCGTFVVSRSQMDYQEAHVHLLTLLRRSAEEFQKLPGSAILLRYIQSSYQNDPIRSAVELFLVLFAVRYLLAPKYSTKPNYVTLSEEVSSGAAKSALWERSHFINRELRVGWK